MANSEIIDLTSSSTSSSSLPAPSTNNSIVKAKQVVMSDNEVYVLLENNKLYVCGYNNRGQLGIGNELYAHTFTLIAENVKEIVTKDGFGKQWCVFWYLTLDNKLYGCGLNDHGQQGDGTTTNVFVPTLRAENVKLARCCGYTSWYITFDNKLYGCGQNNKGQQGDGTTNDILTFTLRAENVADIICNDELTMYITLNKELFICGNNYAGQQGDGTTTDVKTFTKRAENVVKASSGFDSVSYLNTSNELFIAGVNGYGQQGSGNTTNVKTFTKRAENVKDFGNENYYGWYIGNDDKLYMTGSNEYGEQGVGSSVNSDKATSFGERGHQVISFAGGLRTCAYIDKNNDLFMCGRNQNGCQGAGFVGIDTDKYNTTNTSCIKTFTYRASNVDKVIMQEKSAAYIDKDGYVYRCGRNFGHPQGIGDRSMNISIFKKLEIAGQEQTDEN